MKTIKEIKEVAEREVDALFGSGETLGQECFVAGANWMRKELTRWRDTDVIPDDHTPVLICTSPGIYFIAVYDKQCDYWFTGNGPLYRYEIIGWRPIHE